MTNKLLIVFIATAIGFFVGKFLSTKLKDKRLYYSGLCDFINKLQQNLSFKQQSMSEFINECKLHSNTVFLGQLEKFQTYITTDCEIEITLNAKAEEKNRIKEFFLGLGKVDIFTQRDSLKCFGEEFAQKLEHYKNEEKTKGAMMIKLGILFGAAVGILLL